MSSHVAKLLLANASLHADDNDAHDLIVGFGNVSVAFYHARDPRVGVLSPAERHVPTWELLEAQQSYDWYIRAASRAPCGLEKGKETPARGCATTVEAVPITFRHSSRRRLHRSRFSARLGLTEAHHGEQLPHETDGKIWTKLLPEEWQSLPKDGGVR